MKTKIIFIWLLSLLTYSFPSQAKIRTIVIDAGHGGQVPGARGKYSKEKDLNLQVALKLGKLFKKNIPNVRIIYTRTTNKNLSLSARTRIAKRYKADLFISIHTNGSHSRSDKGIEIYYYRGKSKEIAQSIRKEIKRNTNRQFNFIKCKGYNVLYYNNRPGLLIEIGYITNRTEEKQLHSYKIQNDIVKAIYRGVKRYC